MTHDGCGGVNRDEGCGASIKGPGRAYAWIWTPLHRLLPYHPHITTSVASLGRGPTRHDGLDDGTSGNRIWRIWRMRVMPELIN